MSAVPEDVAVSEPATEEHLVYVLIENRRPVAVYPSLEAAVAGSEEQPRVAHWHAFSDREWVWGWWEIRAVPYRAGLSCVPPRIELQAEIAQLKQAIRQFLEFHVWYLAAPVDELLPRLDERHEHALEALRAAVAVEGTGE